MAPGCPQPSGALLLAAALPAGSGPQPPLGEVRGDEFREARGGNQQGLILLMDREGSAFPRSGDVVPKESTGSALPDLKGQLLPTVLETRGSQNQLVTTARPPQPDPQHRALLQHHGCATAVPCCCSASCPPQPQLPLHFPPKKKPPGPCSSSTHSYFPCRKRILTLETLGAHNKNGEWDLLKQS